MTKLLNDKVAKDWGTKPAWNRQKSDEVQCKDCGERDKKKLVKDKRRAHGVQNMCISCHTKRYGKTEATRRAKRRYYHRHKDMAVNSKPYQILYDPEGIFRRGAEFSKADFELSLGGTVWPYGLFVRYMETGECFQVRGTALYPVADRDWRRYAQARLDF